MQRFWANLFGLAVMAAAFIRWLLDLISLAGVPEDISTWLLVIGTIFDDLWLVIPVLLGLSIIIITNVPVLRFWDYQTLVSNAIPRDLIPDISAREAFRHLMLDSKWSISRYVETSEEGKANNTGGKLYNELEAELRDKVRAGRLKIWARPQVKFSGGLIQTQIEIEPSLMEGARFDLVSCMGMGESARIIDYTTQSWTVYEDVMINKAQMLFLWPKANWFEKKRDSTYEGRTKFFRKEWNEP